MSRVCQRCNHANTSEAKFCLQCGAMLEVEVVDAGDPLIGKILLGRYRVTKVLGEGGMGKVYLAEQKMGTAVRKVAIKTLHTELGGDPQIVARFHRECETVIELHHPNTVQFYDFGELDDKSLFIVMEFIEGEDLSHTLQRGALDPQRTDKILIQVCGSLNEAHQRGIVHRDLKPENVLLTQRGGQSDFVKVLDFGIAKRSEAEDESQAKLTKQGMVLGTPPYMSPEQFSGQALDFRSDIYSLGVMTYEMATGHLPFEARTPWEWATKHLTQAPAPIDSYPQGATLPERKKAAIMRALSKNRDDRHGSVLEFMHDFTGMQDAQVAWTMATSAGYTSQGNAQPAPGGPPSDPRIPIPTPQPMVAQHAPGYPSQGGFGPPSGGFGTPSNPGYPQGNGGLGMGHSNPGFSGGYDSQPVQSGSGAGKILLIVLPILLLLGAAGAGGIYMLTRPEAPVATPPQPLPTPQPIATTTNPPVDVKPDASVGTAVVPPAPPPNTPAVVPDPPPATDPPPTTAMDTPPPSMDPAPNMQDADEPTPAQIEQARNLARDASGALGRNDLEGAVRSLAQAQRIVGRSHSAVSSVRGQIAQRGATKVGIMLQQGNCGGAQALYRQLRQVGAETGARGFFSPDWCARP